MQIYDVFNGDADGICTLIQLRVLVARQWLVFSPSPPLCGGGVGERG